MLWVNRKEALAIIDNELLVTDVKKLPALTTVN